MEMLTHTKSCRTINNEITLLTEDGEGDNIARAKSLIDDASAFLEKEL